MASLFGFFKRKPRPDAVTPPPVETPGDAAPVPSEPGADVAIAHSSEPTSAREPQADTVTLDSSHAEAAPQAGAPAVTCTDSEVASATEAADAAAEGAPDTPEPGRSNWFSRLKEVTFGSAPAEAEAAPQPAPLQDPTPPEPAASAGWFSRLKEGLSKTRQQLGGRLVGVFGAGRKLDEAFYEELETVLLVSDVGVAATEFLLENLRARARREGYTEAEQLKEALGDLLLDLLRPLARPLDVSTARPFVIMLAGVNGSGKTTSIGKLARYYQQQGKKVLLAAGDTFRAAAREQLAVWGERNNVTVVTQQSGDAAAVIFDAVNAASARGIDIVLADTAGRLPTQLHLMEEIRKVKRVVAKALPGAPHEVLLVLDANTGQNALAQVKAFDDALGVTGLVMTKLDGTAKGGVIAAIAHTRVKSNGGQPIPLRFIGIGEGIDDLRPFDAEDFIAALIGDEETVA
jgi:fused signal recognition particle receptor